MENNFITLNLQDVAQKQKETTQWNEFIDAIIEGRVVPVIGPEFISEIDPNHTDIYTNHHKQLIDVLVKACCIEKDFDTFSQLVHDPQFISKTNGNTKLIYSLITEVIDQINEQGHLRPSKLLKKLLRTKLFPFVITTSFSPLVEIVMKEIWGENEVTVLQYRNDSKRDLLPGVGDVRSELDLKKPTIFYMFGKYSRESNRYVVTDMDMMEFCKSWLTGGTKVPPILSQALKKKYLLVLGNNYSDWLFRFIWFSMRDTQDMLHSSLILQKDIENSLLNFLEQLQTFIEKDPNHVVDEIERRVLERFDSSKQSKMNNKYDTDVFLSYSRRDVSVIEKLYQALKAEGLNVWYDNTDIPKGAEWKSVIERGIKSTRLFIPFLSHNIELEYLFPHEYRDEWDIASMLSKKMGGRSFILPIAEEGFDFYNLETKIPAEIRSINALWYKPSDNFQQIAKEVKIIINDLITKENNIAK